MKMKRLFCILILSLIIHSVAFAQRMSVNAPSTVSVGEQFSIAYTINTDNVKNFHTPSLRGLDLLAGPFSSTYSSMQMINGRSSSSSSITYTITVMATRAGTFTVSPASAIANGHSVSSRTLSIKAVNGGHASAAARGRSVPSGGGGASVSRPSGGRGVSSKDLFVTASISKTNVYEQEAIVLTYKVYTLVQLQGFNNVTLPDFKGFHSQEMKLAQAGSLKPDNYKGRTYYSTVLRQFVLFPQQSGKLTLPSAHFDASVVKDVPTNDPFDAMLNGTSQVMVSKTLVTPPLTINVRALPGTRPANFSGGVGSFSIKAFTKSPIIKTNDALSIKLVISGIGNMKLITPPAMIFPGDFEAYDPKTTEQFALTSNGVSGTKTIEYLAIPHNPGKYTIPGVSFTYFDSRLNQYKTIKSNDIKVTIIKGNSNSASTNFTDQSGTRLLNRDIRYIKTGDAPMESRGSVFFGTVPYCLWYLIPLVLFITLLVLYRQKAIDNANVVKMRNKKANKVAAKRLKNAGKLMTANKQNEFYDEVLRALWGYTGDKLSISVSQLSKDNIESELIKRGAADDLTQDFLKVLDQCEYARYAPGDPNEAMDKVYTFAIDVISKMEDVIKQ